MTPRSMGVVLLGLLGACSPSAGDERGACYPNGTCNAGLACLSNLCVVVSFDAGPDDAGLDDAGRAPIDAAAGDDADLDAPGDSGTLGTPCDPWTSTCDDGQACVFEVGLVRSGMTGRCRHLGSLAEGDACAIASAECGPGLTCMGTELLTTDGRGWCRRICDPLAPSPCGASEVCHPVLPGSDETSRCGLCWRTCDPAANDWAGDCPHASCVPVRAGTFLCLGSGGSRGVGEECTGEEGAFACSTGSFCGGLPEDPLDPVCYRYCALGAPCPDAGTTCRPFLFLDPSDVGYCG